MPSDPASSTLHAGLRAILVCPACKGPLEDRPGAMACTRCATSHPAPAGRPPDLRLQRPTTTSPEIILGGPAPDGNAIECRPLEANPSPQVDLASARIPHHLTREMVSWFPKASSKESLALDLGCGEGIHQGIVEHAGFQYVGLDWKCTGATLHGDAHALPFQEAAFEFVLSVAVLEHVAWPFLMGREACRVLRPGGLFIGTVAFLEPFHEESHYHHTHLGTLHTLRQGGFEVLKLAPSEEWNVLTAQAGGGFFPGIPRGAARALVMPLELLQRGLWRLREGLRPRADRPSRTRNTTGAFAFVARKPLR